MMALSALFPHTNFGAGSRAAVIPRAYCDVPQERAISDEVYATAKSDFLARKTSAQIVILGAGIGQRGDEYFSAVPDAVFVDDERNVALGRALQPYRQWEFTRFESYPALEALAERLQTSAPRIIVVDDLLHRLEDPRPLLWLLRTLLAEDTESRVYLSNRDRPAGTRAVTRETSYREWTGPELSALLSCCGFSVETHTYLDPEGLPGQSKSVCKLHWDPARVEQQLLEQHLPPLSLAYVICSTEHSDCKITGGIGAYVAQMMKVLPEPSRALIFLGEDGDLPTTLDPQWLLKRRFLPAEWRGSAGEAAAEIVSALVVVYGALSVAEYQDYLAVGLRSAELKRGSRLPSRLTIKNRCHGSQLYLEACLSRWSDNPRMGIEEKRAIELADIVSFPTRFLETLYLGRGYRIAPTQRELLRLPFCTPLAPPVAYRDVDTIIFFGKRTEMKGFPLFVAMMCQLRLTSVATRIKKIIIVGRDDAETRADSERLMSAWHGTEIVSFHGTSKQAVERIAASAPRALCLMPYRGDNHPMSVLEAVATGCTTLSAFAGGIPEIIPAQWHRHFLHKLNVDAYLGALVQLIEMPLQARGDTTRACAQHTLDAYRDLSAPMSYESARRASARSSTVAVIVPCFNTDLVYLRDLLRSLNEQSHAINDLCFCDDGSDTGYADKLEALIVNESRFPARLLRHARNQGLAAARNTLLHATRCDYVINIDSDDIAKPHFVADMVAYLDRNPDMVAVTTHLECFDDGSDFRDAQHLRIIYRPLGDGAILAQSENCLGHANSAFRRDFLLSIGGWDDHDTSKWEDWSLYLKILSRGARIGVLPWSPLLYRVRASSMVRTYSDFTAQVRLGRATSSLNHFDGFRLQALARQASADRARLGEAQENEATLRLALAEAHAQLDEMRRTVSRLQRLRQHVTRFLHGDRQ